MDKLPIERQLGAQLRMDVALIDREKHYGNQQDIPILCRRNGLNDGEMAFMTSVKADVTCLECLELIHS